MSRGNRSRLRIRGQNQPLKIELETSASIIYLVGENGAGKSRFIDGLREGRIGISIQHNESNRQHIPFRYFDWGMNQEEFNYNDSAKKTFNDINNTLTLSEQLPITLDERTQKGKTELKDGKLIRNDEVLEQPVRNEIDFTGIDQLSEGTGKLHRLLNWTLNEGMKSQFLPTSNKKRTGDPNLILVVGFEEPENSFHPKVQKIIPRLLNDWLGKQRVNKPILLVISTHSPFVIKGASNFPDTQRVYGISNLELTDLSGKGNSDTAQKGVTGSQAVIAANKLLGSGVGDLFPNPILLTENSVNVLLKTVADSLNLSFDEFVVTTNGDSDIEARLKSLVYMSKILRKMHKSYPERHIFSFKIIVIIDDSETAERLNNQFANDHDLSVEVHSIGSKQLEDAYSQNHLNEFIHEHYPSHAPWNPEQGLINSYLKNTLKLENSDKGKFKSDLAKFVGEKIQTTHTLEKELPEVMTLLKKIGIIKR